MKINGVLTHFQNMQIFKLYLHLITNKQTHCCTRCKENPFCEKIHINSKWFLAYYNIHTVKHTKVPPYANDKRKFGVLRL